MYDLSHFTGRKADDFPDWHILIKRSLNMIISQNKHSIALRLYIYATIAHNFNKYKQNADKAIENVVL
jgi:hypothetical protein